MSKTVKIEGFIHTRVNDWDGKREFTFAQFGDWTSCGYVQVAPHSFEYTLPDDFNPTQAELAAIEKEKAKTVAEFTKRLAQLNERIANLQAITYEPSEVVS